MATNYKVGKGDDLPLGKAAAQFHEGLARLCDTATNIGICGTSPDPYSAGTYVVYVANRERDGEGDICAVRSQATQQAFYSSLIGETEARVPGRAEDDAWVKSAKVTLLQAQNDAEHCSQKIKVAHFTPHHLQVFDEVVMSRFISALLEGRLWSLEPMALARAAKRLRADVTDLNIRFGEGELEDA